jgi:23S rRNA A2030 N6-methylase RlmJ
MIVINPPWKLDETLSRLLPELLAALQTGEPGQTRWEWLAPAH